jgi:thiol-disulfide isomerase/thioredoxin
MRIALVVALLIALAACSASAQTLDAAKHLYIFKNDPGIPPVYPDFSTGLAEALKQKKLFLVFFYATSGCLYCNREAKEFDRLRRDPAFAKIFVFIQVHVPDDQTGTKIYKALENTEVPIISAFTPETDRTNEVSRLTGLWFYADARPTIIADLCREVRTAKAILNDATLAQLNCPK